MLSVFSNTRRLDRSFRGSLLRMIPSVAVALALGTAAYAQDRAGEIDEIFRWATADSPGCAVAVSQDGAQVVNRTYGLADLDRGIPISAATIFDIGSVQKQFVAAAILLLVDDGRIALADDIHTYFPELPDYGHRITIDHLLTHTSGLRDWIGLARMSSEDEEALTMILRQRGLNFAPGEEWSYSNSGYVLLKELVARTTGMSFAEFARKRLFEPLGMAATSYAEDIRSAGERGALAYEKEGEAWKPDMMLGEERGGGAVLSTASDLLIWNESLANARLGAFVSEKIQEPARLNNGRVLDYARGLFVEESRGRKVVWHTGSAGAYKAMLARFPQHVLSLAILCNAGEAADRSGFARRIVDLFVPAADISEGEVNDPVASADSNGVVDLDLSGREGLFFSESTGEPLRLILHENRLRILGGPPLVAGSENHFRNPEGDLSFMSGDEFELKFVSKDAFELTSIEGETTRYRRAHPHTPTAANLEELIGRYESDEMRAVFELEHQDGVLTIRLNGSRAFELEPVQRDIFQLGRMLLRFRRDSVGDVVSIDYSNPMLRNVTFRRTSSAVGTRPER